MFQTSLKHETKSQPTFWMRFKLQSSLLFIRRRRVKKSGARRDWQNKDAEQDRLATTLKQKSQQQWRTRLALKSSRMRSSTTFIMPKNSGRAKQLIE
jgi:hypothetical protein